jgi:nucleolin
MMMMNKLSMRVPTKASAPRCMLAKPNLSIARPVLICMAVAEGYNPGTKIHISNLSWNLTEEDINAQFSQVGTVTGVELWKNNMTGRSNGMGIVEFATAEEAASAVERLDGIEFAGRTLRVKLDQGRVERSDRAPREMRERAPRNYEARERTPRNYEDSEGRKLFVSNLSYDTNWMTLKDHFQTIGSVAFTKILTDRETGQSKGFGFVEMGSAEEAQAAIEQLGGTELDGRAINVRMSEPKPAGDRPPREDRYERRAPRNDYNDGGDRYERRGGRGGSRRNTRDEYY